MLTLIEVKGTPVPKERPRLIKGRVFTPTKTLAAEELIGWQARNAGVKLATGDVAMTVVFHFANRRHGDIDNLAKTVLDALNGVAYADDRQVKQLTLGIVLGSHEAKTVIQVSA